VERKDRFFTEYDWPVEIKVRKDLKGELIVRAEVLQPKHFDPPLPEEWTRPKVPASVHPINSLSATRK
jgi:hypothetical protein